MTAIQRRRIFKGLELYENATDLHPQDCLRHLTLRTKNDRDIAVLEDKGNRDF